MTMVESAAKSHERMSIRSPSKDREVVKELKVKIPVGYHVKLHALKVITGKQMRDAVTEALDAYFATNDRFGEAAREPMRVGDPA
ncbi:MAG TPA: hypothetical protein VM889_05740 [Candidatus Thermoplasmatota archaeon]|nr:hypothetical protein [Candidatus Thermoplasmatota archaeon]